MNKVLAIELDPIVRELLVSYDGNQCSMRGAAFIRGDRDENRDHWFNFNDAGVSRLVYAGSTAGTGPFSTGILAERSWARGGPSPGRT